jgi:hypothetical protein
METVGVAAGNGVCVVADDRVVGVGVAKATLLVSEESTK